MAIFIPSLKAKGHLDVIHFTVCLVGSRKIMQEDDLGSGAWSLLAPNLTIYGFDVDSDACDTANSALETRQINWTENHIPLAISEKIGESILYVTGHPSCSSLYPPNEAFIQRLTGYQFSTTLDFTVEIETTTLDDFFNQENSQTIDFLQVDVQGADLKVLQGATQLLERGILGVQTEVEFSPLYINQPLFADVDGFLRNLGFTLFDIMTDNPWCRCTRACSPLRSAKRAGQLLWADACYLRDPISDNGHFPRTDPLQILKLACLADVLDFPDYALELLAYLTAHYGKDSAYNFEPVIIEALSQFPELINQGLESLPVMHKIRHLNQ